MHPSATSPTTASPFWSDATTCKNDQLTLKGSPWSGYVVPHQKHPRLPYGGAQRRAGRFPTAPCIRQPFWQQPTPKAADSAQVPVDYTPYKKCQKAARCKARHGHLCQLSDRLCHTRPGAGKAPAGGIANQTKKGTDCSVPFFFTYALYKSISLVLVSRRAEPVLAVLCRPESRWSRRPSTGVMPTLHSRTGSASRLPAYTRYLP